MIFTGKITTYPGRSRYQIVIESMEPAGVGALLAQLEERKKKLAAEGLFDADAQAAAAVPARGGRRDHLADRRGDPRHPAPHRRPLAVPGDRLAGGGAGREAAAQVAAAIDGFSRLHAGRAVPARTC